MGLFDGTVDHALQQMQPILKDLEEKIAVAVSAGLQNALDRIDGAKITVTVELPPPKPMK